MKKVFFTGLLVILSLGASAQDIQFHYDFGKHMYSDKEDGRQNVTLTYEGFKADGTGSWYYFIDTDFDKNGVMGAYTEISREFNLAKTAETSSVAAHVECDAGMNRFGSFQTSGLFGAAWNWHSQNFKRTFSVQLLYKQYFGQKYDSGLRTKGYASVQLTGVWSTTFANDKLTFSGYIDFWRGKNTKDNGEIGGCLVICTEPQLWYNISKHCSVGTEWEVSHNFIYRSDTGNNDDFFLNPTLAFKYNF